MTQAVGYLEVANGRLRSTVTAVVAAAAAAPGEERDRVLAALRTALGTGAGAGVVAFLGGLLMGLEEGGS